MSILESPSNYSSQMTAWYINIAAEEYNPQISQTLSASPSHGCCSHTWTQLQTRPHLQYIKILISHVHCKVYAQFFLTCNQQAFSILPHCHSGILSLFWFPGFDTYLALCMLFVDLLTNVCFQFLRLCLMYLLQALIKLQCTPTCICICCCMKKPRCIHIRFLFLYLHNLERQCFS